jgi:hypothetical protein
LISGTIATSCNPLCKVANSYANVSNPLVTFGATVMTFSDNATEAQAILYAAECKKFINHAEYYEIYLNGTGINCSAPTNCTPPSQTCQDALLKYFPARLCPNCDESATSENILNFTYLCDDDCTTLLNACPAPPSNESLACDSLFEMRNISTRGNICHQSSHCRKFSEIATVLPPFSCGGSTTTSGSGSTTTGATNGSSTISTTTGSTSASSTVTPSTTGSGLVVVLSVVALVVALI